MTSSQTIAKPKRRLWQFSLRAFFVVITLTPLAGMKNLQELDLYVTLVTPEQIDSLQKSLRSGS